MVSSSWTSVNSGESTEAWSLLSRTLEEARGYMCVLQALWGVNHALFAHRSKNLVPWRSQPLSVNRPSDAIRVTKMKDVDPKRQGKPVKSAVTSQAIQIATR